MFRGAMLRKVLHILGAIAIVAVWLILLITAIVLTGCHAPNVRTDLPGPRAVAP